MAAPVAMGQVGGSTCRSGLLGVPPDLQCLSVGSHGFICPAAWSKPEVLWDVALDCRQHRAINWTE